MSERNIRFQNLVEQEDIVVVPGCFDALSARILEQQGSDAVYVSGAGVSNTKLGIADVGLVTQTEMCEQVQYVSEKVDVPVFADADTGYGNPVHVRRTVQLYEQVGVSALHIEDQAFPKKCGHFDGKQLIPVEDMAAKVRAAVDAREHDDFTVVARTDARAVDGVDAAIERANAYVDAGADMVFPEAPESKEEMQRFVDDIDAPVMANMVEDGKTPLLDAEALEEIGFALVIFPNSLLRAAMVAMQETAEHLAEHGSTAAIVDRIADFDLRNALTDYEQVTELEDRYAER